MPGLDGTGPRGFGPLTGGGRGFCNPFGPIRPGMGYQYAGYRPYQWFGQARGWGMGYPSSGYPIYPQYGYPYPRAGLGYGGRGLGRGWQAYGRPAIPWGAYAPPVW